MSVDFVRYQKDSELEQKAERRCEFVSSVGGAPLEVYEGFMEF